MALTKPPLGARLDGSSALSKSLRHLWLLNEGGGIRIFNAGSLPTPVGTSLLNTAWTQTSRGPAFKGDGSTQGIVLGTATDLHVSELASANTIAFWCLIPTGAAAAHILSMWDTVGGVNQRTFILALTAGQAIEQYWSPIGSNDGLVITTTTTATNVWRHVCATFVITSGTTGTRTVYINGRSEGTPLGVQIYTGATTNRLGIGYLPGRVGDTGIAYSTAIVDHVRIYTRCLRPDEVMELYRNPYAGISRPRRRRSFSVSAGGFFSRYYYEHTHTGGVNV